MHTTKPIRRASRPGLVAVLAVGLTAAVAASPATSQPQATVVSFDAASDLGTVDRLLFGVNHRFNNDGSGMFDPAALEPYPGFAQQSRDAGLSIVRFPGGTVANTYHWRRAVGPQQDRLPNLHGGGFRGPVANTFGPDEFGAYIEQIGAAGSLVVNFADGTSDEAADFVEYMTAPAGSGPLAAERAANGHPEPYDIRYVEVANEPELGGQRYWRAGDVVEFAQPACGTHRMACLYSYGGTTAFPSQLQPDLQLVGRFADFRAGADVGDGSTTDFYLRYPPVVPGSVHLFVGGQETTAFVLDPATGAVSFTQPPAAGERVTATFHSGPHQGMVGFYDAIEARDLGVPVCSSFDEVEFFQITAGDDRVDCAVQHPYTPTNPGGTCATPEEFFGPLVLEAPRRGANVRQRQAWLDTYAPGRGVELILSEYGHLGAAGGNCTGFHRTLGEGVFTGLLLRQWINEDIPIAMRHALVDFVFGPQPPGVVGNPENAIISGPGPDTVPQPQALVLNLFRHMAGPTQIATAVTGNPTRTLSDGRTLPALVPVATRDAAGNAYLIVMNQDPETSVTATIAPQNFAASHVATAWTVSGPGLMASNTVADPHNVRIHKQTSITSGGQLSRTFPAHSVTAVRLTPGSKVVQYAFDKLAAGAPPSGWQVSGPAGSFTVQPDVDGSTGNVLQVTRADGAGLVRGDRVFGTPQGGLVRASLRVRAEQTDAALGVHVLDSSGAPVARVGLNASGRLAYSDGGQWSQGPEYHPGRWQWLDLVLDQSAGTLAVHHDGRLVDTVALDGAGPAAAIRVQLPVSPASGGTFYVDDVVVTG